MIVVMYPTSTGPHQRPVGSQLPIISSTGRSADTLGDAMEFQFRASTGRLLENLLFGTGRQKQCR